MIKQKCQFWNGHFIFLILQKHTFTMRPILLFIGLSAGIVGHAQTWKDTTASLEKILSRYPENGPGAELAIGRNGKVIYSAARGMANLEDSVRLTTVSRIEAGSVSKQFTAACILLLEQQGKLSLNDDIRKYFPEIPDYGHVITIRHLMNHTSGIKDWGAVAAISGWPRSSKTYSNDDALHIICLQKTLNNVPGDEYIYSNSNYNLQAILIQRLSGMSLAVFSLKNIFIPAEMTHTEWRDDFNRVVAHRAIAYDKREGQYFTNMPNEYVYGNGGLLTTAEDLLRWNDYYLNGRLGSPSLLNRQLSVVPLNNGKRHGYAAGLVVDSLNGQPVITHSGATAGYRANLEYFPRLGLSIAWLSNNSENGSTGVPGAVRNLFVENKKGTLITPAARKSDIDPKIFQPYLGAYADPVTGEGMRLYGKADGIYSETHGGRLEIVNATTLRAGRARLVFTSGAPRLLRFISAGGDTTLYSGVDTASADAVSLQAYAGKYYSDETESAMYFVIKDGGLQMYPRVGSEEKLTPMYKDGFSFADGYVVFQRDAAGAVNGFYVSIPRARKVRFRL